ncbi:MAG: hypothetical protein ACKO3K_14390 [Cuspidothrix sp.]
MLSLASSYLVLLSALAATPIFLIGFLWKNRDSDKNSKISLIISLLVFAFLLLNIFDYNQFYQLWHFLSYDMKRAICGVPVLSLLLAIGMIIFLSQISKFISKQVPLLSKIIGGLGEASMIILYLHMTFIYGLKGTNLVTSFFNLSILSIILSFLVYLIILRFSLTRAIFLGSYSDFEKIFLARNKL